jgi:hypothetical protein
MAFDLTTGDAILKELYPNDVLKNLTYKDHPFLQMVPKFEKFTGDSMVVPLTIGNPQGRSATFSTAVTNKGNSTVKKFVVTHARDYSLASIDNLMIEVSKDSAGSFAQAFKFEVDNAINSLSHAVARDLFRSGSGSIGRVATSGGLGATSITLQNIEEVVNFEVGMELKLDSVDGGGTVHTGSVTVTDVNRDTGVLTTDATSAIGSAADGDYIFQEGDYDAKLKGLAAWLPTSAPGSTAFFGLDRTTDTTRLAGVRIASTDVDGLPIEEKLQHAASRAAREGGSPDVCLVNYENFRNIEISLGSKAVYDRVPEGGVWGWNGLTMRGPKGPVKVVPDQNCPPGVAYLLTLSTWMLASPGPAIKILDRDGKLLRESTSDAYEVRMAFYGNLVCKAPGWNAVVDLT